MVVQAKFADSHIDDGKPMENKEVEQKLSIQKIGLENKSFEKNENEADQKVDEKTERISTTANSSESDEL